MDASSLLIDITYPLGGTLYRLGRNTLPEFDQCALRVANLAQPRFRDAEGRRRYRPCPARRPRVFHDIILKGSRAHLRLEPEGA